MTLADKIKQHNDMITALSEGKDIPEKVAGYEAAQKPPVKKESVMDKISRLALAFYRRQKKVPTVARTKQPRQTFGDIMVKKVAGLPE